jgi:transglutaminase-like putative cysteine protease
VGLTLFFIAYPNPVKFLQTVARAINPPIEPAAVAAISATLPNDPARIEEWVTEHIAYDANDYEGWGVIEYFANPTEVLQRGKGPCYGRAVVLASILAEKGIPFRIYATVGHVWVDYAGRQSQKLIENTESAQFRWENGQWYFQGLGSLAMAAWATAGITKLYWDYVPLLAKIVLLTLIAVVVTLRWQLWRGFKPRAHS